jgi:hypothetical protein
MQGKQEGIVIHKDELTRPLITLGYTDLKPPSSKLASLLAVSK